MLCPCRMTPCVEELGDGFDEGAIQFLCWGGQGKMKGGEEQAGGPCGIFSLELFGSPGRKAIRVAFQQIGNVRFPVNSPRTPGQSSSMEPVGLCRLVRGRHGG